mmetsp:Transcript_50962/g.95315  ORF Transcript_50962/g.95315 Transcript_50962/m.95315 type:complete len:430 (+) Transcript_50962:94-1383(+)
MALSISKPLAMGGLAGVIVYYTADKQKLLKSVLAALTAAVAKALTMTFSRSLIGLPMEPWPHQEWVDQYEEDAVEPEIAIFDAHHHLWDHWTQNRVEFGLGYTKSQMKYMRSLKPSVLTSKFADDPGFKVVNDAFGYRLPFLRTYMAEEMMSDIRGNGRGHKITGTMIVECGWTTRGAEPCMKSVAEADMAAEVNRDNPILCQAIIPQVDLTLGAACEPALKYLKQNPLVKGIRYSTWCVEDDYYFKHHATKETPFDPKFREGFALLSKYGFTYESWVCYQNIKALTDLAKCFPETKIICDHVGVPLGQGPYKLEETIPQWKEDMIAFAANKNAYVKIGGMGMSNFGWGFEFRPKPPTSDELVKVWGPLVLFCVETFGVDRCIMESNFPMDKISCSYTVLWNAMKKIVKSYSKEDKQKLCELLRPIYSI